MEEIELFKNEAKILEEINRCKEVKQTLQRLHKLLNSKGLNISFSGLKQVTEKYIVTSREQNFNPQNEVAELIKNITVDSTPETNKVMGFKLNREKLKELIEVDETDTQEVLNLLTTLKLTDCNLMQLIDFNVKTEKITIKADFKESIQQKHTVYASNERQIEATGILTKLKDVLNEYGNKCRYFDKPDVQGLKITVNGYELDINRIKRL